ncbi:hypothetical protein E8E12_011436 [Didymella heteroderae]|uniref:Uncharacterized protein n=1 Tax=Didymella heteroderae TaxID=1769908 RepID=A0A9P4WZ63_9PLEO|nr:hypothetical protein E8E12_011436 [Didymella heteroderae]
MGLGISSMEAVRNMDAFKYKIKIAWYNLVAEYSRMSEDKDITGTQMLKGKETVYFKAQSQNLSSYYDSLIGSARSLLHTILVRNPGDHSLVNQINFDTNTLLPSYEPNILDALNHVQRSNTQRAQRLKLENCQINLTVSSGWFIKRVIPFLNDDSSLNRIGLVLDYMSKTKPVKMDIEVWPLSMGTQVLMLETVFREQNDPDEEYTLFMAVHLGKADSHDWWDRPRWELYFDCSVGSVQVTKDTLHLTSRVFSMHGPDALGNLAPELTPVAILKTVVEID